MKILKFIFGYKKIVTQGGIINYYPMVPCTFSWKNKKSPLYDGLLDSGSDGIVIPLELAEWLGLDLNHKAKMEALGRVLKRYVTKIDLILGRGGRYIQLNNVEVSVPIESKTAMILIGRNPIFELYEITFIEPEKKVVMKPYKTSREKK
ncbi:MAG: hypothetical protein KAJ51_03880 [Thermoplasmata archaeon]|nr:hypothetical protein [Thermoplasmata archaeon]